MCGGWADKRGISAVITGGHDDLFDVLGRINISLFNVPHYICVICQVVDAIGALLKYIATTVRFCRSNLTKRRHHFRVKRCDWSPWVLKHAQHCFSLAVHSEKRVPESYSKWGEYNLLSICCRNVSQHFENLKVVFLIILTGMSTYWKQGTINKFMNQSNAMCAT